MKKQYLKSSITITIPTKERYFFLDEISILNITSEFDHGHD